MAADASDRKEGKGPSRSNKIRRVVRTEPASLTVRIRIGDIGTDVALIVDYDTDKEI